MLVLTGAILSNFVKIITTKTSFLRPAQLTLLSCGRKRRGEGEKGGGRSSNPPLFPLPPPPHISIQCLPRRLQPLVSAVLVGKARSVLKLPSFVSTFSLVCFIDGIGCESNFICFGHLGIKFSKLASFDELENGTKISLFI